jgi:predicted nucleic acid-binding protein
MKYLILDSGPLINFAMNGILPLLKKLKQEFNGKFLITKEVKFETMDYPETKKRFELEALQIETLFKEKIIELPELNREQQKQFERKTVEIINLANSTFYSNERNIHLIDKGEAEVLALSSILKEENVIVIDERTTRMLCENPENLRKLMENKLHTRINVNKRNFDYFKNFKIIRSTELAYIASKKKLLDIKDSRVLDAMLYGLKIKGCSISEQEIEQIKQL